jgi:GNAT superfamily N-acetyltransferase
MRSLVWNVGAGLPADLGTLLGWWDGDELIGAFLHGPVVVMCCEDAAGLAAFAERVGYYWYEQPVAQLMAPRSMSEVFLAALADHFGALPPLHLLRHRMPAMRLTRAQLPSAHSLGIIHEMSPPLLRQGRASDEALLGQMARDVTVEDLGLDPLVFAPDSFWAALRHRIALGREYLWMEADRPMFRAALSAATPEAVLVEGVYVPPESRRQGYGKAGMHALCAHLLEQHEAVVLLVGEDNDAARLLYELLGFSTFDEYQAAFFDVDLGLAPPQSDGDDPL